MNKVFCLYILVDHHAPSMHTTPPDVCIRLASISNLCALYTYVCSCCGGERNSSLEIDKDIVMIDFVLKAGLLVAKTEANQSKTLRLLKKI